MWQNFPAVITFFDLHLASFYDILKGSCGCWDSYWGNRRLEIWAVIFVLEQCGGGEARGQWQRGAVMWGRCQKREQTVMIYKAVKLAFDPPLPKPILPFLPHLFLFIMLVFRYLGSSTYTHSWQGKSGKYTQSLIGWVAARKTWQWYFHSKDHAAVLIEISRASNCILSHIFQILSKFIGLLRIYHSCIWEGCCKELSNYLSILLP